LLYISGRDIVFHMTSTDTDRGGRTVLGAVIALAFILRLVYVLLNPSPAIVDDSLHYDDIATNLAGGNGFSMSNEHLLEADRPEDGGPAPTARRPALYPVFLSLFYRALGQNYLAVLMVQAVLGTFCCYLTYALALAAFGNLRAAQIALALSAVYPPFVRYCAGLLTEIIFLTLTMAAFLAAHSVVTNGRLRMSVLAGILGGLAMLCRPTALFFLPLQGILLLWVAGGPGAVRRWVSHMLAYAVAFSLVMSPWIIRNYAVFDTFIPGFTSAGYNLFMGTYPAARGLANLEPEDWPAELREDLEGAGEIETDAIFRRYAFKNIADQPFEYVKLVSMKLVRGWFVIKTGHRWAPTPLSVVVHGPLLMLAFAGIALGWSRRRFAVFLIAVGAVAFTGFHALVVSNLRYNLPAVPFAIILASAALAWLASKFSRERASVDA
jgi:4-amino-4-deoxy-L-arabinose transferase-like glycosyltransferase